jgi:hypothetical protein
VSYRECIDDLLRNINANVTALILERDELLRRVANLKVGENGDLDGVLPCGHEVLFIMMNARQPYCTVCWSKQL